MALAILITLVCGSAAVCLWLILRLIRDERKPENERTSTHTPDVWNNYQPTKLSFKPEHQPPVYAASSVPRYAACNDCGTEVGRPDGYSGSLVCPACDSARRYRASAPTEIVYESSSDSASDLLTAIAVEAIIESSFDSGSVGDFDSGDSSFDSGGGDFGGGGSTGDF